MKLLALAVFAASCAFAQDEAPDPVTPITLVVTAPVSPVAVNLIAVLDSAATSPAQIQALVARLSPADIARVTKAPADRPSALSALVGAMSVEQAAKVIDALANDPATLSIVLSQIDASKLAQLKVDLFLTDLDGWKALSAFLDEPLVAKPFGNWLAVERASLAKRVAHDGYTPELLGEAQKLMRRAAPLTSGHK